MPLRILPCFFLISLALCSISLPAQVLSDCRNPCEKTRTIRYGAFIGVKIADSLARKEVHVVEVLPQTAAEAFGVKVGDILTHLNGVKLDITARLLSEVAKQQPGAEVSLRINRRGESIELVFPLGAQFSKTVNEWVCCDEEIPLAGTYTFSLSPELAQNSLTLQSDARIMEEVQVDMVDANGLLLQSERRVDREGSFGVTMDIHSLPAGTYFLKIKIGKEQYVKRFRKGESK